MPFRLLTYKLEGIEMTEKDFDIKEHLVKTLDAPMATLFKVEDSASSILQEVAYSMRNQYLKLHEESSAESKHDFSQVDKFIEFMKRSGVPAEIRANREQLIKFLGAGLATFIDVVEFGSPILRQVEYSWRFAEIGGQPEHLPFFKHEPLPPCWSVMVGAPFKQMTQQVKHQIMECYGGKVHPVPHIRPQPKQHVEMHCDTIFWSVEAPDGCCGLPFIREGILKQSVKACAILGITIPKYQVESIVRHPVEVELVDSPAVREGAVSCDIRIHLTQSLIRISSRPCLEPFGLDVTHYYGFTPKG